MTMLYKLADAAGWTRFGKHNETLWGPGVTHTATGDGGLCSDGVIHAYRDPLLAVLMDPVHGGYGASARMWEAKGKVVDDDGTKVGCKTLTTVREVSLPTITNNQRSAFIIICAMEFCTNATWMQWAQNWLNGSDRSRITAEKAGYAVFRVAHDAKMSAQLMLADTVNLAGMRAVYKEDRKARSASMVATVAVTSAIAATTDNAERVRACAAAAAKWPLSGLDLPQLAQRAMEIN